MNFAFSIFLRKLIYKTVRLNGKIGQNGGICLFKKIRKSTGFIEVWILSFPNYI